MAQRTASENGDLRSSSKLPAAVLDAQILLGYAAQKGLDVDDQVIKTVVECASAVRGVTLKDEQEIAFWAAFKTLAKAVSPVSVSSLRATMDSHRQAHTLFFGIDVGRSSTARWAVRRYTIFIVAILVVLLSVQIYWVFGSSIISDIQSNKKQITALESQIQTVKSSRPLTKTVSGPLIRTSAVDDPELGILQRQLDSRKLQQKTSYHLLDTWTSLFDFLLSWTPAPNTNSVVESICDGGDGDGSLCEDVARTQSVTVLLDVVERYGLPLLYGLLGSCVYVLRTLSGEIRTRTFTEASLIGFRVRVCLGTLGGMVVAWFVAPTAAEGFFKSLSPFALAFLAGYSIELVFAAMDKFIVAFTKPEPKTT
jgi:hypothetical protein